MKSVVRGDVQLKRLAISELDGLPGFRRALVGLGALISVVPSAYFGVAFLLISADHFGLAFVQDLGLGIGLLWVSLFMLMVWLRTWFGPRQWVDRILYRLFLKTCFWLSLGICVLLAFVAIQLLRG